MENFEKTLNQELIKDTKDLIVSRRIVANQLKQQNDIYEIQVSLAKRGLDNTLAFQSASLAKYEALLQRIDDELETRKVLNMDQATIVQTKKINNMPLNNKTIRIHCNKCNHDANHNVILEKTEREVTPERVGINVIDFWLDTKIQILKCGSCSEYALRTVTIWCDDAPDFPERDEKIYPKRGKSSIIPPDKFKNVPSSIVAIYAETIDAFQNNINRLCAGGARAILEAICEEKNIKGGITPNGQRDNLEGKIYGLCENGFITSSHSEILHQHRYLGNKALHKLEEPSSDELQIAIEIIAHTLDTIYEIQSKGKELKTKKDNRK